MKFYAVLTLLWIASCAPLASYDDMTDPEQLERFEADVEKADEWIAQYYYCDRTGTCIMTCDYRGVSMQRQSTKRYIERLDTLDKKVRWYRNIRSTCGFTTPEELERIFY